MGTATPAASSARGPPPRCWLSCVGRGGPGGPAPQQTPPD
ncbi:hypothetical protein PRBEI_2000804900 [Prionailurus iriomotensis]